MNKIYLKYKKEDSLKDTKDIIIDCFNKSLSSASPMKLTKSAVLGLGNIDRDKLTVFAFGKAAASMLNGLAEALDMKKIKGLLSSNIIPDDFNVEIKKFYSSHPVPNQESINAGDYAINITKNINRNDTVICLISGGGSSLFESLYEGINLEVQQRLSTSLLKLGMEDHEINMFRKLLSCIKGGKLAELISPARIINIIISDDVNNSIEAVASGPTVKSTISKEELEETYYKWELDKNLPLDLSIIIKDLVEGFSEITNKISSIENSIILDNAIFLEYLKVNLEKETSIKNISVYNKKILNNKKNMLSYLDYIKDEIKKTYKGEVLVLAGGEIPVSVVNDGKGGRNQHFSAVVLKEFEADEGWVFASIGTDGQDYIRGISGAMISSTEINICKDEKIDINKYVSDTNSHMLHKILNTHIFCDKGTGFNVSDIYIFYYKEN